MWTAEGFAEVLKRHPDGGTLWTRTHRMVRYIRVFRSEDTTVALMTEKWAWRGKSSDKVELFVRTPAGAGVAEFLNPSKTPEFLQRILKDPILDTVYYRFRLEVENFISTPDETRLVTW